MAVISLTRFSFTEVTDVTNVRPSHESSRKLLERSL